jgi:hypothetical protein
MAARAQQDRLVVAQAAVSCGRLSGAVSVRADRGECSAQADGYRVSVTEPAAGPEVVLEHWGEDAEMLAPRASVLVPGRAAGPQQRARVAARTISYYGLDGLRIDWADGTELRARGATVVLYGPRRGWPRRRRRLLAATLDELL